MVEVLRVRVDACTALSLLARANRKSQAGRFGAPPTRRPRPIFVGLLPYAGYCAVSTASPTLIKVARGVSLLSLRVVCKARNGAAKIATAEGKTAEALVQLKKLGAIEVAATTI